MTNIAHITETALLLLAAYLLGCAIGYGLRRTLHAARGTRQVAPEIVASASAPVPAPADIRRPAARLAASVDDLPPPRSAAPRSVVAESPSAKPKPATPTPATLSIPRDGAPDNLKQIKGIGPKIEASLNALGVFHIDQIAAWTRADIDWVDGKLAFKGRIRRERWVEQALEVTRQKAGA